jgi:hypothetical protein
MRPSYEAMAKMWLNSTEPIGDGLKWDIFLCAFDNTERVAHVFEAALAARKIWIVQPQFGIPDDQLPSGAEVFKSPALREDDFMADLKSYVGALADKRVAIDITGLLRPHIAFIVRWLVAMKVKTFHAVYAEPTSYSALHDTQFVQGGVDDVRPIAGFEGSNSVELEPKELLVICAGYERELILRVAEKKRTARKLVILGFPPLQADFYQQNVLQVFRDAESLAPEGGAPVFAPANDPFITAAVVSEMLERERKRSGSQHVYLSPISTKAQALGIALYHVWEARTLSVSLIYPFARLYNPKAAVGVAKVGVFTVELPES